MSVELGQPLTAVNWPTRDFETDCEPEHRGELHGSRPSTITTRSSAVERVIRVMRERFKEPLTLHEMAEIAQFSPFHFDRMFRRTTGIPPSKFLAALRMEAAKRLLLTSRLRATDVCYEVGYNSLGSFTTHFSHLVGMPPSRLRQFASGRATELERTLCNSSGDVLGAMVPRPLITGWISSPDGAPGPIFVGLFATPLPERRPIACTLLRGPDCYAMGPVPDGRYHLLAAAFPPSPDPLTYLLPDQATVRVGANPWPLEVRDGQPTEQLNLRLRPLQPIDPPLLTALPLLMAERAAARSAANAEECLASPGRQADPTDARAVEIAERLMDGRPALIPHGE